MKQGYDVFGKAYGVMLRNDLHDIHSIDYKLIQEMVYLDNESYAFLYNSKPEKIDMKNHELYSFAQQFKGMDDRDTINNILTYTKKIADEFDVDFEEMKFGGTEQEILERGTDWCADLARVGAVLLTCNNIPARIIHLANPLKAYNGHVVVEAFYEDKYGICDFVYGYCFYDISPLSAYDLMTNGNILENYPKSYSDMYQAVAISEYNPMDCDNDYTVSSPNSYYLTLISSNHQDTWIMGEDK